MSISSTGLYGSATIVNTDIFDDVQALKEQVTTLSTSYLQTTAEHRTDISQNRFDVSKNKLDINDISSNKIPDLILDVSKNTLDINDISSNKIPDLILDVSKNTLHIYIYYLTITLAFFCRRKAGVGSGCEDIMQMREERERGEGERY
jgi:hypothetical protein